MADDAEQVGTVIRGSDGSLYFLREEVLEAAKVTEDDMNQFLEKLLEENESEVSGFGMVSGQIQASVAFRGPFTAKSNIQIKPGAAAASTIMCPGVMKDKSFQVINPGMSAGGSIG